MFVEKNQLRAWPICWIGRALYVKTSHHYLHLFGICGVLSASRVSVDLLCAQPQVCLHRFQWEKAIGRRRGQILPQENRAAVCEGGCKHRSEIASGSHDCPGTSACPLAFEMLAFCEGSAGCCRCGEVQAADNAGQTSRPGVGEQLRVQKTSRLESLRSTCRVCAGLWRQERRWPC